MARKFNGTSDKAVSTIDLSSYSSATAAFWLWTDNHTGSNAHIFAYDAIPATNSGAWQCLANQTTNPIVFIANSGATLYWQDHFTAPSDNAWHHWMIAVNRATPTNFVWIDGVAQTLVSDGHSAGAYGNFGNLSMTLFAQASTQFGVGRMADFTVWGGAVLTTANAVALTTGASPLSVRPSNIVMYLPLFGADSPEPDYSGSRHSATLTGTTTAAHPGIHTGLGAL